MDILDRADKLHWPGHPTHAYHVRRARYLEQLRNTTDAVKEREQATKRPPTTALDFYLLGDLHYKQGNVPEAIGAFNSALRLQSDHFWAQYFLSVSYLRLVPPRPDLALLGLTACLSQRPQFIWLYLLRGHANTQLKQYQAAEEDYKKAERLLEREPSQDARHVLHANWGVLRFQQKRYDEAIAYLREAINEKPEEYQAYLALAQVYLEQEEWERAREQLDRAIKLEPGLALLHRLRARLYLERKDFDAALRSYEKAIKLETPAGRSPILASDLAKDHAQRGRILHGTKRYQEAVKAYNAALNVDPSYVSAYLWRAQAQLKLRMYEETADSCEEYRKRGGKAVVELYQARGIAWAQLGNSHDAIQDFAQALAMKPEDLPTLAARGWAYLAVAAYRLALPDFEKVIQLDPKNADAYNGRAYARVHLGQYPEAVEDAQAALKWAPKRSPQLLYDAARIYAQAAGKARTQVLARRYQDRAVTLIRESLNSIPDTKERRRFWREKVLPDGALSPIHRSTEFNELRAAYAQWGK